ncbi:nitrous oxide reductase accessory protein NosL [Paracoccus sp. p4-l81]|uniref:nitrous oxide reductase accessory protein NosL n=1 Tax=Paracoccus sp. p4-l81 TaxID=3342806 RepID=UPI0035BA31A7
MRWLLILPLALMTAACRDEAQALPDPVQMTAQAVGHYCQMNLLEHPGPKAQVHLEDNPNPLFFSQVRDAIAYARMPEQAAPITVIYVSDMARAPDWDHPGDSNWMPATAAHYVIGSRRDGGMGAPETVPFSDAAAAQAFAAEWGGQVVAYDAIRSEDVLSAGAPAPDAATDAADQDDYASRLRALAPQRETNP